MSLNVGDRVVSLTILPLGKTEGKVIAVHGATAWVIFDGETTPRSMATVLLQKAELKTGDTVKLAAGFSPSWRGTILAGNGKWLWVKANGTEQPMTYKREQLLRA